MLKPNHLTLSIVEQDRFLAIRRSRFSKKYSLKTDASLALI